MSYVTGEATGKLSTSIRTSEGRVYDAMGEV